MTLSEKELLERHASSNKAKVDVAKVIVLGAFASVLAIVVLAVATCEPHHDAYRECMKDMAGATGGNNK